MQLSLQPHSPDSVLEQLEQIIDFAEMQQANERRQSDRAVLYLPVEVQPLDAHYRPQGEPIAGLSRNVSVSGMAFLLQEAVGSGFASVRFQIGQRKLEPLFVEIVWRQKRGPFVDLGVKLVMDWDGGAW